MSELISGILTLLDIENPQSATLFKDQFQNTYIAIESSGSKVLNIDSAEFAQWLFAFVYEQTGKTISDTALKAIQKMLKHKAKYTFPLTVRVGKKKDTIYYDLGENKFVSITSERWNVIDTNYQILFKRFGHQITQIEPQREGNLDDFFKFTRVSDKSDELLLKVYIVSSFIPNFPHPVLVVHGVQGSAKSTLCRLLKSLIDPSVLETQSVQKDISEFIQLASHNWFLVLDNLSFLTDEISDVICRICTGGGLSKRKLYTDNEDHIFSFRHLVVINGIKQVVEKPDLLDRCLMIELEPIGEGKRLTEEEVYKGFSAAKPGILGAIFFAVSGAMKEYPNIHVDNLPRMADFVKWGCAIAKALGHTQEEFLDAYARNTNIQTDAAAESNPLATTIFEFMEDKDFYQGTPSDLYKALVHKAEELSLKDSYGWPKAANVFSKQIPTIRPVLQSLGLKINPTRGKQRKIIITRFSNDSNVDIQTEPSTQTIYDTGPINGAVVATVGTDGLFSPFPKR